MILKLQPEQISAMWDAIKYSAVEANGITSEKAPEFLNNLLCNLMAGTAQVWLSFKDEPTGRDIYAILITCVMTEQVLGMSYLLVHSLHSYKTISLDLVHEAIEALYQYGRANKCHKIVAMTLDERLTKLYQHVGMQRDVYVYSKEL